jgi:hypothetical protein
MDGEIPIARWRECRDNLALLRRARAISGGVPKHPKLNVMY